MHRYVLQCSAQKCADAFLGAQVPAFGRCGRTLEVMEIDDEARRLVAELAEASSQVRDDGNYVMRIPGSGRMREPANGSRQGLFEQFESVGRWYRENPDVPLRTMPPSALSTELKGAMGEDWVSLDERFATLDAARVACRAQAWWERSLSHLSPSSTLQALRSPVMLVWSPTTSSQLRAVQRPPGTCLPHR